MTNNYATGTFTGLIALSAVLTGVILNTPDTHAADSITVTLSGNPTVTVAPSANGTFADSGNIDIAVNNAGTSGYTLAIKASNGTSLVGTTDNTKSITSISQATSADSFTNNTWGYKPSKYNSEANTQYRPSPSTDDWDVLDAKESGFGDNYTMSIGTKVTNQIGFQSYANGFVITAIANKTNTIEDITYMQEIDDQVIASMTIDQQYQLKDKRDEKTYYVARMKDGKVWMTQNLDYDISTSKPLTSETSNLTTYGSQNYDSANGYSCSNSEPDCKGGVITWTPSASTLANSSYSSWTSSYYNPVSWDGGNTYRYTSGSNEADTEYTSLSACQTAKGKDAGCEHYHVGNYYNWTAAVASNSTSGLSTNRTVMSNSICPANWRLPQGQTTSTNTDAGYYSEINYTWLLEGVATNYVTSSATSATYKTTNDITGFNAIRTAPLYMTRAGYRSGTAAAVSQPGAYGDYFTSTIYSANYAYAPYFTSSNLFPMNSTGTYAYRNYGESVRCVAMQQSNHGKTIITFDKNASDTTGTTGTDNTQTIDANNLGTLASNGFSRSGYAFNSWNTEADGSGARYADASEYYAAAGSSIINITLYAQWDDGYTITYDINGGDSGTMATQTAVIGSNATLHASNFSRSGYGFAGWSENSSAQPNDGISTIYGPMENLPAKTSDSITLYAVWVAAESNVTMQTFKPTASPYSSHSKGKVIALRDERDDNVYAVAKLDDGNWWMMENLRLDDSATINSSNTHNPVSSFTKLSATSNSWCTSSSTSSCINQSYLNTNNTVARADNASISENIYSYGNYYNWYSATAGNGTYGTGSNVSVSGDICPLGWKLPYGSTSTTTGNRSGGFYYLGVKMGATADNAVSSGIWRSYPHNYLLAGFYNSSRGYRSTYATSTSYNNKMAYRFDFSDTTLRINFTYYQGKPNGSPIRCVAGS